MARHSNSPGDLQTLHFPEGSEHQRSAPPGNGVLQGPARGRQWCDWRCPGFRGRVLELDGPVRALSPPRPARATSDPLAIRPLDCARLPLSCLSTPARRMWHFLPPGHLPLSAAVPHSASIEAAPASPSSRLHQPNRAGPPKTGPSVMPGILK